MKKEDNYEVISGNHRVLTAIKNGIKKLSVLCLCEPNERNLCVTINNRFYINREVNII